MSTNDNETDIILLILTGFSDTAYFELTNCVFIKSKKNNVVKQPCANTENIIYVVCDPKHKTSPNSFPPVSRNTSAIEVTIPC